MKIRSVPVQLGSAHRELAEAVHRTVGSFLGTGFSSGISNSKGELSPITAGLCATGLYALIPIMQMLFMPSSRELILLSWWGAMYFGVVVALTRSTSLAVIEIVDELLLPNISEEFAISTREKITKGFVRSTIFVKSLGSACIAILTSCLILHRQFAWPLLYVWGSGFFVLYFTAAQATLTAPFYTCFSHTLRKQSADLFEIDPAASPAVSACTMLARRILYYWFLVFLLVISLLAIPVIMTQPFVSGFVSKPAADMSLFISSVVFVAGFFSFIFGSLIYLGFESDVRIAVERVRLASLSVLQAAYCDLYYRQLVLSAEESAQLDRMKNASDYLSKSGNLRTSAQVLGTLFAAILPPLVSIVVALLTYYKKTAPVIRP
jgi:hypothetical protein